jgi:tryptophan synthase alpha subunit
MLQDVADGVIVGSAIVRQVEQAATRSLDDVAAAVGALVEALQAALNPQ